MDDSLLACPVCLEPAMCEPVTLPCQHSFCADCVRRLPRPLCPICRAPLGPDVLAAGCNRVLSGLVDALFPGRQQRLARERLAVFKLEWLRFDRDRAHAVELRALAQSLQLLALALGPDGQRRLAGEIQATRAEYAALVGELKPRRAALEARCPLTPTAREAFAQLPGTEEELSGLCGAL